MNILLIDNYDSFTYNLAHIIRKIIGRVDVIRNDKISSEDCLKYDGIILSPGPGIPENAGNMMEIISNCDGKIPILGICLGMQGVGEYLGCKLLNLSRVYHGVQTSIEILGDSLLYKNLPSGFSVGRYHSWAIDRAGITENTTITSVDSHGDIMSIENQKKKLYGVQYHPESIMTPNGNQIIENFLSSIGK